MAFIVDELGNITLVQGDSGKLVVEGLDTAKSYTVYFEIQDKNRKTIGSQIPVYSEEGFDSVEIKIPGTLTDLLTVNKKNETETYYYGIKICDPEEGFEDTLTIGNSEIGDLNSITVYPRKVEGI